MKVLIDTNNLLRSIPKKSPYRWLWDMFLQEKLILCVSDDKFVDCAVACNADHIITEDKHFHVLSDVEFPKVVAIGIDAFKAIINP